MNKKIIRVISFLMAFAIVISCAACGGKKAANNAQKPTNNTQTIPENIIISKPTVSEDMVKFYTPTSVTLTMFDTETSSYGFTWNTELEPKEAMIQICEGEYFDENKCVEVKASVTKEPIFIPNDAFMYVCKVDTVLDQNKNYTYRAFDKTSGVGGEIATFKTANFSAKSFTFAHISDSQVAGAESDTQHSAIGTGDYLGATLKGIMANKPNFILHTGDFVENSKYETYWKNILHTNAKYLMQMPLMVVAGNHDTTYLAGDNENFKHFNYKIPTQASTNRGYYYSFNYGNTKFIMINTNNLVNQKLETEQYNWLVNELKTNDKKWTIVSLHNPLYSVGEYGVNRPNITMALRSQLASLFATYGVDLVLQGHDHVYSKTYPIDEFGGADLNPTYKTENSIKYTVNPTGTIYAMHGPAGNQKCSPVEVKKNLYEYADVGNKCSWAEVSVENNKLTVHIKYYKNNKTETAYSYGIIKN